MEIDAQVVINQLATEIARLNIELAMARATKVVEHEHPTAEAQPDE